MDNQLNNTTKNVILSFLAGAVVASASVYLSKKENRDDLSKKLDDFKNVLFENSQNAREKVKDASQQIHDTAVEKIGGASHIIHDKSEEVKTIIQDKTDDLKDSVDSLKGKVDDKIDDKTSRKL